MKIKGISISSFSMILLFAAVFAATGCVAPSPLREAALKGDTASAKRLIDSGVNVNEGSGRTSLMVAAAKGNMELVKLLVEKGADVNAVYLPGRLSRTPLAYAAMEGHKDVLQYLVAQGADIDKAIIALRRATTTVKKNRTDNQLALEVLQEFQRSRAHATGPGRATAATPVSAPAAVRSDVDELPAVKRKMNKNAYAIVIGIEHYRQKLPRADFAVQDARTVAEYLTKAMGYPEENVVLLLDDRAGNVDLAKYFEKWLPNNTEQGSSVFIYFSGHGAPDPATGGAYLVPYDGDPSFIAETGYSVKRMYDALARLPAREIVVALDSCFSGAGGRSVLAEGARPLVMNLQTSFTVPANMTVLAAASGNQISSTYKDKGHGLFTYFFLKGIKNEDVFKPDGFLKTDELFGYIKPQVERVARKQYNNEQTPQLFGGRE